MRILIIEDEFNLADVISSRLKNENYIIDNSYDGESGLENALTNIYDLIILDIMLPKINGIDVLKRLRNEKIKSKIIMLTAKSELEDKLEGLNNGANDYITKPFHIDELVARVNVQLRNIDFNISKDYIETGDLRLNIKTTNLLCLKTNESIDIMCKEFQILEYLMQNKGQTISREKIAEKPENTDNVEPQNKPDEENPQIFIDSTIYTVLLDENQNIKDVINHTTDNISDEEITEIAQNIIKNRSRKNLKIGNLYFTNYSYAFNLKNTSLVIMEIIKLKILH